MGWKTLLHTSISFNRKSYDDISLIDDDIELEKSLIERAEKELYMLSTMTDYAKLFSIEGYEQPFDVVRQKVEENIETIKDASVELYRLSLIKNAFENARNKDGVFKKTPDGFNWDDSYITGDCLKVEGNDNE